MRHIVVPWPCIIAPMWCTTAFILRRVFSSRLIYTFLRLRFLFALKEKKKSVVHTMVFVRNMLRSRVAENLQRKEYNQFLALLKSDEKAAAKHTIISFLDWNILSIKKKTFVYNLVFASNFYKFISIQFFPLTLLTLISTFIQDWGNWIFVLFHSLFLLVFKLKLEWNSVDEIWY